MAFERVVMDRVGLGLLNGLAEFGGKWRMLGED